MSQIQQLIPFCRVSILMCVGACVCAWVYMLRVVSMDKILYCINTSVIINYYWSDVKKL